MRNKSGVLLLTVIIGVLCLYYLSFTFVARGVQKDAEAFATEANGNINFSKKQRYLDSVWTLPVYNLGFAKYTYEEVKQNELSLGLDLQGGMHVVLEVSPVEIIRLMAGAKAKTPEFQKAMANAQIKQRSSQDNFSKLFVQALKELKPDAKVAAYFANTSNKSLTLQSSDDEVIRLIDRNIEDATDLSYQRLRNRIDKFGVANPSIQKLPTTGRIQVELPGADNPERAEKILTSAAKLEFWQEYDIQEAFGFMMQFSQYLDRTEGKAASTGNTENPFLKKDTATQNTENPFLKQEADSTQNSTHSLQVEKDSAKVNDAKADSAKTMLDSLNQQVRQGAVFNALFKNFGSGYYVSIKDTARVNRLLAKEEVRNLFPSNMVFMWEVKAENDDKSPAFGNVALHILRGFGRENRPLLEGEVVTDAFQDYDQNGRPAVSMRMNNEGARKWQKITRDNVGKNVAIVMDGVVYSAPRINQEIAGGSSIITGNFSVDDAKDLANILKSGKLPASMIIVEKAIVGPSLGQEAISQGLWSMVLGVGLVILFMGFYYNSSGWVANLSLVINVFFILGVQAPLGAVLTLPGIAGLVLTIGMAVDANVLIFERIREELRNGLNLKQAINLGFNKALSSIIDANVTTFLTGFILYTFGTGGVKGFAIVLMIGIACSLFSALLISRLIIEALAKDLNKPKVQFTSFLTKKVRRFFEENDFNFVGSRKKAYTFSALVIAAGIASIVIQGGLNLGVDFSGGRAYVVEFNSAVPVNELRSKLTPNFEGKGTEVKTFGASNKVKVTTSYLIDDSSEEADKTVEAALLKGLEQYQSLSPQIVSTTKVGATVADDIRQTSQVSVIISLIAIFLYILARFRRWQYSVGAIVALAHDVLVVISFYSIANLLGLRLEVDQVFIAAMLTIIGYSINDTVIVFDRIREYVQRNTKASLSQTVNVALNQTLSRTVITALTTFFVVIILLFFGGEVLRGFSFALFIGVIFGTYSSLFIASPIVLDFARKALEEEKQAAIAAKEKKEAQG
jgi:SecD/SecF fusion protein